MLAIFLGVVVLIPFDDYLGVALFLEFDDNLGVPICLGEMSNILTSRFYLYIEGTGGGISYFISGSYTTCC
jgi:hypothetical protein